MGVTPLFWKFKEMNQYPFCHHYTSFKILIAPLLFIEDLAHKYDIETLLTRMLLKGMIEYLTSSV